MIDDETKIVAENLPETDIEFRQLVAELMESQIHQRVMFLDDQLDRVERDRSFIVIDIGESYQGSDWFGTLAFELYEAQHEGSPYIAIHPRAVPFSPVDSSNVQSVGFHPTSAFYDPFQPETHRTLYLRFEGTPGTYVYAEVPYEVARGLWEADSKGGFVHDSIRGEYPYCCVEGGKGE